MQPTEHMSARSQPHPQPGGQEGRVVVRPGGSSPQGEPLVELRPRVVGPGRRERAYQQHASQLQAQLDTAQLVERGAGRFADRLEGKLRAGQRELAEVRGQGNRLLVAIGALQRENEGLYAELQAVRAQLAALPEGRAPESRSLWRRMLQR